MIITRKQVFINFPKTGSSFVRKVLSETFNEKLRHRPPLNRICNSFAKRLPQSGPLGGLRAAWEYWEFNTTSYRVLECFNPVRGYLDQHGKVHQVPKQFLSRRILSVARDPLSRFCSYYHYFKTIGAERHLPLLGNAIKSAGAPLTAISPEEFHDNLFWSHNCIWMQAAALQGVIGPQTLDFVNHFAIDPIAVFRGLEAGGTFAELRHLFPEDIVLMSFDSLAEQLYSELQEAGINTLAADDPVWTARVLPDGIGGNFTGESARNVLSNALVERIEREEWFLYEAYARLSKSGSVRSSRSKAA